MATFYHYPFCPHSRFIRLVLGEIGLSPVCTEEKAWEQSAHLLRINPAGHLPVLVEENGLVVPGAMVIADYLAENYEVPPKKVSLLPERIFERIEVKRLLDWFLNKFFDEVSRYFVEEKIHKRFLSAQCGGGSPDMRMIRAAQTNLRYHLQYIDFLIHQRNWLAGKNLTYGDLAAAAHLSCIDYLGDIPWHEHESAKSWYARIKSRPSFRGLLGDRLPGVAPASHYADLDF